MREGKYPVGEFPAGNIRVEMSVYRVYADMAIVRRRTYACAFYMWINR
jgi:hypothetical protein